MGKKIHLQSIARMTDLTTEPLPGQPLVEIVGDCRVLIERHDGVVEYDCKQISVNISLGQICVCGSCLELAQMTKTQVVITGKISSVSILRRK